MLDNKKKGGRRERERIGKERRKEEGRQDACKKYINKSKYSTYSNNNCILLL